MFRKQRVRSIKRAHIIDADLSNKSISTSDMEVKLQICLTHMASMAIAYLMDIGHGARAPYIWSGSEQ